MCAKAPGAPPPQAPRSRTHSLLCRPKRRRHSRGPAGLRPLQGRPAPSRAAPPRPSAESRGLRGARRPARGPARSSRPCAGGGFVQHPPGAAGPVLDPPRSRLCSVGPLVWAADPRGTSACSPVHKGQERRTRPRPNRTPSWGFIPVSHLDATFTVLVMCPTLPLTLFSTSLPLKGACLKMVASALLSAGRTPPAL